MSFGIVIQGADKVDKDIEALKDTTKIKQAILAGALAIEGTAKKLIQHSTPTGKTYKHGNITHVASAPGEAPATDDGRLVSSIQHWVSDDGFSIAVGSVLVYAKYLEFGTRKMAPRPFIGPAVDMERPDIIDNIKKAIGNSK